MDRDIVGSLTAFAEMGVEMNRQRVKKACDRFGTAESYEEEAEQVGALDNAVHSLRASVDLLGQMREAESNPQLLDPSVWDWRVQKLRYEREVRSWADPLRALENVKRRLAGLPGDSRGARDVLAYQLIEALRRLISRTPPAFSYAEDFVVWLLHLANTSEGMTVTGAEAPQEREVREARARWLKNEPVKGCNSTMGERVISEARSSGLRKEALEGLEPPLEWTEVLWHFYQNLEEERKEIQTAWKSVLRQVGGPRRPCAECGDEFEVRPTHPYQRRHRWCSERRKKRIQRERKRSTSIA